MFFIQLLKNTFLHERKRLTFIVGKAASLFEIPPFTLNFYFTAIRFSWSEAPFLRLAILRLAVFFRVIFRFFAAFRLEAFLRDFFLAAIIFSVLDLPALSIYNETKKSS